MRAPAAHPLPSPHACGGRCHHLIHQLSGGARWTGTTRIRHRRTTPSSPAPRQGPGPGQRLRRRWRGSRTPARGSSSTDGCPRSPSEPTAPNRDRNAKEAFEAIDPRAILAAVVTLPIERSSYKGETVRHLGPMAQDFAAAFGLGADDRHIFPLDAAGVALAAIQGLHRLVQTQKARLEVLERELIALRGDTAALRLELALREGAPVA